ncbi:MAG: ACP S-malonyltransferase [Rickettsiaceae bacterium]|nr:ACP S-malonyltransferase [Rickettsiaceae bacterium]
MNILIFPGQGSQYIGMGKELADNFSVAREVFEEVDDTIDFRLSKLMFEGHIDDLTKTENVQVAIMACGVASLKILELLSNKKIEEFCHLCAGHSLGQYSAMYASGFFDLSTCAKILRNRGYFMRDSAVTAETAMAAVIGAETDFVLSTLADASKLGVADLANDNSNLQKVISGEIIAINYAIDKFKEAGFKAIKLNVSSAFHSKLMEKASKDMEEYLSGLDFMDGKIDIIDNVTLKITNDSSFLKQSLVKQIPATVRWRETMDIIVSKKLPIVEIGASQILSNMTKKSYAKSDVFSTANIKELEQVAGIINKS